MRKNKALLAILGTSALLFSCAVSLSRDEATELLDRIVLRVAEGDFEVPETYSYSSHSVYSTEHEQDINYSYAKTSKYHYMHCKTVTKTGNKDVTDSNGTYKASETETVDEYYYLDPAAVEKTFITYIAREVDTVPEDSGTSIPKGHNKKIVSFQEVIGDEALSSWETKMDDINGDRYSKDISTVAQECDEFLKSLYGKHNVYVKESKYESLGEGSLDMFVTTYGEGKEESITATFEEYLVKRYDVRTESVIKTSTYNWNNAKFIYPDLALARSEIEASASSTIAQLS